MLATRNSLKEIIAKNWAPNQFFERLSSQHNLVSFLCMRERNVFAPLSSLYNFSFSYFFLYVTSYSFIYSSSHGRSITLYCAVEKKILKFFLRFFSSFFIHNKKSLVFACSSYLESFACSLSFSLVRKIFYSRLRCWSLTHYISYII